MNQADNPDETAILAAEDRRIAAILGGDLEALAQLVGEELLYVHGDGVAENRDEYLQGMARSHSAYRSINWIERRVAFWNAPRDQ